jgi:hypothetical protein
MKIKKLFVILITFSSLLIYANSVKGGRISNQNPPSCTIFTAAIGDKVLFGNNEDYEIEGTYMWLFPSQEIEGIEPYSGTGISHGTVFFGFDNNDFRGDGYPQGGMNDQGLCWDANGLPVINMNPHPEREETHPTVHIWFQVLWECSTVNEIIDFFESHYLGSAWGGQIHFADATGDALVVSVGGEGEFAYTRRSDSNYLVSTNFNLANPSNGWHPCERYNTASSMLEEITTEEDLTVDASRDILEAVSQDITSYSNIFDLINRDIYVYYEHDFDKVVKLNLDEELQKVVPGAPGVQWCEFYGKISDYSTENQDGVLVKQVKIADLFNPPISTPIVLAFAIGLPTIGIVVTVVFFKFIKKPRTK